MDIQYSAHLERFANQKHLKRYLDPDSCNILLQKARSLRSQLQEGEWKFEIPREHPLTFKKNDSNLQIDITCKIEGNGSDIEKHNIEFRVWSIKEQDREIVFRFHIDQKTKDSKAKEPWYHLHIGKFDEPRFPFPPMDVILIYEFVLINYFQKDSENLRKDGGWKNLVIHSQDIFQKEYFNVCRNCIENKTDTTLMERLLNLPRGGGF